ncbi:hypothetical protein J421_3983 [Gemmatirosa kalamazoonensis]|uniref:Uncharacterized protein n=1 Tax=Gemmatirosa kalamazoonensis TaxID=861299 RepID=W0RMH6_9BACT|nr:hypothetical protein J421_3983 [Gemmatirosa kalamazoonensis]
MLLGVLTATVADVVARQWRLQGALDARRAARAQLAAAADALRPALRMAAGTRDAADSSDLVVVSDTLLELRAATGASVVCGVVDPSTIDLVPLATAPPALSWWRAAPQPGDVALVHVDDASGGAWIARDVESVGGTTVGCAASPLAATAQPRPRLRLTMPLPGAVAPGAPVRLARRVRWLHYRSGGLWYLGEREWDGAAWTGTQPVAGPLRPPGSRGGLTIVARDSAGNALVGSVVSSRVVRVDVVVRADVPSLTGVRGATSVDSVAFVVAPRGG